jgi:hypothetical protein
MTATRRRAVEAVRPGSGQAVPALADTLRPVHSRWLTETMRELAPALSPGADFWSGWSAVRYLNDQFDGQYRWQRILVAAIMPLLPPSDARVLRAKTDALEEVRYDLDRVGRWRNMTAVTAALASSFLKLLRAWFVEIQRLTQGVTVAELSLEGRRALTQLGSALPNPGGPRV